MNDCKLTDDEKRMSVFNPQLPAMLEQGILDSKYEGDREFIMYAIRSSDDEHWAAEAMAKLPQEMQDELAQFDDDYDYLLKIRLIEREWDEDVLLDAALHNPDDVLRRGAFSRLTGWSHFDPDGELSHITYACDPIDEVPNKRLTELCEALVATEGETRADEMLIEAARELAPKLEWERAARAAGVLEGSVLDRCGEHGEERVPCSEHDHDHDIDLSAWDNA